MTTTHWRLILSKPLEGAWNMAVDEAILEAAGKGQAPPTLRLYAWSPPCLSLGYAQPIGDIDSTELKLQGWQLVRRPTGGRAILHTDEITYSVMAPLHDPHLAGGVLESYRRLSIALVQALTELGLSAQAEREYNLPTGARRDGPVCFEVPSNYEITAGGKKLIGSAQARRLTGILQHGSLPLIGDLSRITRVLAFSDEEARSQAAARLLEHATTAESVLGKQVTWEESARAIVHAFETCLDLKLTEDHLNGFELRSAAEFVQTKYGNAEWTARI
jgi:lipoate-protein ligase A